MNLATFIRQRVRIERRFKRGAKRERALRHLVADAGAVSVIVGRQVVAWRLPDGVAVCTMRRYSNAVSAHQDLERIMAGSSEDKVPYRIYPCPHCNGFHLTSQLRNNLTKANGYLRG